MFTNLLNKIDDHLNPIIVKELRQVVRGRFFWGVLVLFLGFQCAVLSLSIADRGMSNHSVGSEALTFLFAILFLGCFTLIPLHSGFRFAKERGESSEELLFITTITPHSIIRGKLAASMVFIMLIFSAFAPFMAMTFFLSGVDMPLMFLILFLGLLICAAATMLQLALGSLARDASAFNLLRALGLFIQVTMFFSLTGLVSEIIRYGVTRMFGTTEFYASVGTVVFFISCSVYFLYLAAAAVISPAGSNKMLPVRKFLSLFWLLSFLIVILWQTTKSSSYLVLGWGFVSILCLNFMLVVSVSERDFLTRRVAREMPTGFFRNRLSFLLSSGAAGGISWCLSMIAATIVTVVVSTKYGLLAHYASGLSDFFEFSFGFTFYILAYSLLASFIRRVFLSEYISVRNTWVVALVLCAAFALAPMFLGAFVGADSDLLMVGNPFSIASSKSKEMGIMFALVMSIIGLLVNASWFIRQAREIFALDKKVVFEADVEK